MVLKLRLRHALGEAQFDFDEALGGRPLLVGRGPGAAVEVPSLRVGSRHCAIFLHDGLWVVQDGNSRSGTSVNGQPLPGSRAVWPLAPADVIRLGDEVNAPTLTIEAIEGGGAPAGAITANGAEGGLIPWSARPHSPLTTLPAVSAAASGLAEAAAAPESFDAHTETALNGAPEPAWARAASEDDVERRPSRPRQRRAGSPLALMAGFAVTVVIIAAGIAAYWAFRPYMMPPALQSAMGRAPQAGPPREVIVVPDPAPRPPAGQAAAATAPATRPAQSPEIADNGVPAEPARAEATADAAGLPDVLEGVAPDDPLRQAPEWIAVARAHQELAPGARLLAYDGYLQLGPPSPLKGVVGAWQEETLDELWWRRIGTLLDEEFSLVDRQIAIEAELRLMPRERQSEMARALQDELARVRQRLAEVAVELGERMDYQAGLVPNLSNDSQLERLRLGRNAERYEGWKAGMLQLVRETGGQIPWLPEREDR